MTPREIANLCCRVLAVYVLIMGVSAAPAAIAAVGMYASSGMPVSMWVWYIVMVTVYPLIQSVLGIWLWRKSNIVAAWMIGHDLQDAPDEPDIHRRMPTAREMHAIAFSVMGLWLLVTSVPRLIVTGVSMAAYGQMPKNLPEGYVNEWGINSLGDVAKALIGSYLLFGASGLVKILRGAKNFGLEESERPEHARSDDASSGVRREGDDRA